MRLVFSAVALCLASATPAFAVEVRECDWAAQAPSIAEPWEKNSKSFYRGQVRVALIDTGGEPVCCSAQLLILIPDNSEGAGGRMCRLVGSTGQLGFENIDFARLATHYDAGRGLLIVFPYTLYVDGLSHTSGAGRVRVNVERGTVRVE